MSVNTLEIPEINSVKILVTGKNNVGKSTLIKRLTGNAHNVEHRGLTVGLDIGSRQVGNKKFLFFGTPGQSRFSFMRRILSEGLNFGILVVDPSQGLGSEDRELIQMMDDLRVPYMIFVNKTDVGDFNYTFKTKTIWGSAKDGTGIDELVQNIEDMT